MNYQVNDMRENVGGEMNKINHLETKLAPRYDDSDPDQEGNKNVVFADLFIDGKSLYQMLKKYDFVPSLGWGTEEEQQESIDYFLLKQLHPELYYRYPILVCPWCKDEECGYVSVLIEREGDFISWSDFRLEPHNRKIDLESFTFKWKDYKREIIRTYRMAAMHN
ncbi:oxidoreductase [Paenibacillus xylanexedens]|uniref:oxidoreductase n=1 Tax=Paenibacillus xylanexedens TaxID=528191 RepID=UPI0028CB39FA|nr:oxidoreductase [Paenibacillus xylanexedens]